MKHLLTLILALVISFNANANANANTDLTNFNNSYNELLKQYVKTIGLKKIQSLL
jgi:hypothetical protein